MSKNVPTSTQWVTFPTNPRNAVLLEWTSGGKRSATYYVTKAYWGDIDKKLETQIGVKITHAVKRLEAKVGAVEAMQGAAKAMIPVYKDPKKIAKEEKDAKKKEDAAKELLAEAERQKSMEQLAREAMRKEKTDKLQSFLGRMRLQNVALDSEPKTHPKPIVSEEQIVNIRGETQLFIAAEFVEEQYCGGPMEDYHVKSLTRPKNSPANTEYAPWVTMQLTECFHYGQTGNGQSLRRWLVYHPSIAPGVPSPRIFQHRFTGLASAEIAKAGSEDLPPYAPEAFKAAAEAGGKLTSIGVDIMKSAVGHYLHPFLDGYGRSLASYVQKQLQVEEIKIQAITARIIALQLMEALLAHRENDRADDGAQKRLEMELEYVRRATGIIREKTWLERATLWFKGVPSFWKVNNTKVPDTSKLIAEALLVEMRYGAGDDDDDVVDAMLAEFVEEETNPSNQTQQDQGGNKPKTRGSIRMREFKVEEFNQFSRQQEALIAEEGKPTSLPENRRYEASGNSRNSDIDFDPHNVPPKTNSLVVNNNMYGSLLQERLSRNTGK